MESSVIINVKLKGAIKGCVASVDKQTHYIKVPDPKNKKKTISCIRKIIHTDRKETECIRSFTIVGEIVTSWIKECPSWEYLDKWKTMTKKQKIRSYIQSYDEGFGVSYESIEDGEI